MVRDWLGIVLCALSRSLAQLLIYQHCDARRWRSRHGRDVCRWEDPACADEPSATVAAKYMREEAGRSVFEEGHKLASGKRLTIAQKRHIANGNPEPIDQVRDEKAREREEEVRRVAERRRIAEEEQARNAAFYQKMLATPESTSTNGHTKTRSF